MPKMSEFVLRLMNANDKDLVLSWRNSERVRENMYTDHVISIEEHDRWFQRALTDDTARYLIFEHNARPVGFASLTGISTQHDRCSWAFYLGEIDVPKGTGPAMEYFVLCYAFEELKIRKLCCEVFLFNASVIKLHEKFGFAREGHFVKHYKKNNGYDDIVCLAKFGDGWATEKETLKVRCFGKSEA